MNELMLALAALLFVGHTLLLCALVVNARRARDLAREPVPDDLAGGAGPSVVALIPVRNEEANIGACLAALRATSYSPLRIRVIDDGSIDGTPAIVSAHAAMDPRVEMLKAGPLPSGWLGKSHALWQGVRGATEDWLLFVDADLRLEPECLTRALAAARRAEADLVSVVPALEAHSFWEWAVQPLVGLLVCALTPVREVETPGRKEAAATGPFLLVRRARYEAAGGHAAVRADIVEDLRLAEAVKRAGGKLLWTRAPTLARLRMYDSLGAIVRGWSKNFHVGLGGAHWAAPPVAAVILLFFAGPYLLPLLALAVHATAAAAVAAAATGFLAFERLGLWRFYGVRMRGLLLLPLGAAVLAFILLRAAHRAATGRTIEWKGRPVL